MSPPILSLWPYLWRAFLPFAVLAVWLYMIAPDHPWRGETIYLLKAYAALILSFLGGIHWGIAADDTHVYAPISYPGRSIPGQEVPPDLKPGLYAVNLNDGTIDWKRVGRAAAS